MQEGQEKVIKGLELCRYDPDPGMPLKSEVSCDICPYWDDTYGCRMNDMFDDAIALLKAQENSIPIDWLMQYAQLPTEIAISAWNKPMKDALKAQLRNADKPMPFDDALQLVNELLPPMKEGE